MGGKFHLKLNTGGRPIANKYREGKMQRTLKRELKVLEIVKRESIGSSFRCRANQSLCGALVRVLSRTFVRRRACIMRGTRRCTSSGGGSASVRWLGEMCCGTVARVRLGVRENV